MFKIGGVKECEYQVLWLLLQNQGLMNVIHAFLVVFKYEQDMIAFTRCMTVYSDYLSSAGKQLQCPSGEVDPSQLLALAKSQV